MKSKFLSMCLSLLVSIGIWLYVTNVVSPESVETFLGVPVELQGVAQLEERGLVITSVSHNDVSLQVSGNRTDLMQLSSENICVEVDVSKINSPGVYELSYKEVFPGMISVSAVDVKSHSPETIRVTVEKRASKKVSVELDYIGAVPQDYLTDEANVQLSTKSIQISGPATLVNTIQKAIITVDLTGCTESIAQNFSYTLVDGAGNAVNSEGIRADASFVYLNLQIRKLKEVPVTFDVVYGGGATQENTTVVAAVESILISGHKNLLDEISSLYLGKIDLAEVMESDTVLLPVELPAGVRNETSTTMVAVEITFSGLTTKNIIARNIKAVNVPEGMVARFMDDELLVTIRGNKQDIDAVTAGQISVIVDFGTTREGTSSMPVDIIISGVDPAKVGAIGKYTLVADMQRGE